MAVRARPIKTTEAGSGVLRSSEVYVIVAVTPRLRVVTLSIVPILGMTLLEPST